MDYSSTMLMCIHTSLGDRRTWAVLPSKWAPHPTSKASVVRVVWGVGGVNRMLARTLNRLHHHVREAKTEVGIRTSLPKWSDCGL